MRVEWAGQHERSIRRVGVIARGAFLEAVRDRILVVPLMFAVLLIGVALSTRTLSLGHHVKILQDFGLAGISFFSDILVLLAVATSLARELERGSILPVLAKPVRRGELLLGKYVGILLVVLVNIVSILVGLRLALMLVGGPWSNGILWAAALSMVEVAVVGAVAVFFSVVTSPLLAMIFGGLAMFIGHMTLDLRELGVKIGSRWAHAAGDVLYYTLPNLEIFDVRGAAVHGYPIGSAYLFSAFVYGALYAAVVLFASSWAFQRRNLA